MNVATNYLTDSPEVFFEECVFEWDWRRGDFRGCNTPILEPYSPAIDAEQFHKHLSVDRNFKEWLEEALDLLGYEIDCSDDCHTIFNNRGNPIGHALSLQAARELALIQNTAKGWKAAGEIQKWQNLTGV